MIYFWDTFIAKSSLKIKMKSSNSGVFLLLNNASFRDL